MQKKTHAKQQARPHALEAGTETDRYEVIIDTAARLFALEGYSRTPLDVLAREIGIHKATLYYYISSKEELLAICLQRAAAEMDLALRHLQDPREPVMDRLHYFFSSFLVAQSGLYGRCVAAVGSESLGLEPAAAIRAYDHGLEDAVAAALAEGVARAEIAACDPDVVARILFAAFHWVPRWYETARDTASLGAVARLFIDCVAHGLAGPKCRELPPLPKPVAQAVVPLDRRAEIVLLATRCFTEKGYDAASIGDIAQAVGLQKASLYHHFPGGKAAILAECVRLAQQDVAIVLQQLKEDRRRFEARFIGFLRRLMQSQSNPYGIYLRLVRDEQLAPETQEDMRAFRQDLSEAMQGLISEGMANGYLRVMDVTLASHFVFGMTNGLHRWDVASPLGAEPSNMTQVGEAILTQLTKGLGL